MTTTHRQRITTTALIFAFGLLLAPVAKSETSALAKIKARGRLRMLCFPHMRSGFARPDLSQGPTRRIGDASHFEGIDVELMQGFAESLGVELEIHTLETPGYAPLIPALLEGRVDLIASSLTINDERRQLVDFSQPYFTVHKLIISRDDEALESPDDLAGKVAVTIQGSSHQATLNHLGIPKNRQRLVEFTSEYYTAIEEGDADFAVVDSITAARDLGDFPTLEIAFQLPGDEHYGIALPKGSDLRPVLDRYLTAREKSGEMAEIKRRFLSRSNEER